MRQTQLLFFGPGAYVNGALVPPPSPADIRKLLSDRSNPECPFYGYVGNNEAVEDLCDILFAALMKPNHCAGPNGIALIGPASTGKTTLSRMLGVKGLKLPFVECDRSIRNTDDLKNRMLEVFKRSGVPLVATHGEKVLHYRCPPGVIYFDEAQALKGDWLLKATERKDATLIASDAVIDCQNILWIISTTHRGKLPKAFDSRFQKVFLYSYTLDEVSQIVKGEHPDLPMEVCSKIAGYGGRIPREALDFAVAVKQAALRLGTRNWLEACKVVSVRKGVDEEGYTRQHLSILVALFKNSNRHGDRVPISLKRLSDQVNIEEEDLEEYVLPGLMVQIGDRMPLIRNSNLGIELTAEGINALVRRNLVKKKEIEPDKAMASRTTKE